MNTQFPSPPAYHDRNHPYHDLRSTKHDLPHDFFARLAALIARDAELAARIDFTSLAALEAGSLRSRFLQMCMRGQVDQCHGLWSRLSEFYRRDFMTVYELGPPSRDYFLHIMAEDDRAYSECGSSSAGDMEVRSDYTI